MRKIFISADIEGITGVTGWCETRYGGQGYDAACRQMSLETAAACRAALDAGYEVVVKDGHEDGLNIDANLLPKGTQLIRSWMSDPYAMMAGLDQSYDGAIYIGYHAKAWSNDSPLTHTIEDYLFNWIKVNGELASEFSLNALLADEMSVPSIFLSGDKGICDDAKSLYPSMETVAVKHGTGNATWNIHPEEAIALIEDGVKKALAAKHQSKPLANEYRMEINFKKHQKARHASWYPGAKQIDSNTVEIIAKTPTDLAIARMFMTGV